jgi:hypothetical protein
MTLESHKDTASGHSSQRDQRDDPGPPHPSACLPHDTLMGIHGWPMHYPNIILEVWWDSFHLGDTINPVCAST